MDTTPTIPSGAGFGIRLVARLIDIVYGLILGLFVGFFGGMIIAILAHFGKLPSNWQELMGQARVGEFALSILGGYLYHVVSQGIGAVTLGKTICGLRVVQLDGRPVTFKGAFIRDLAYYWDGLFFGLVGSSPWRKGRCVRGMAMSGRRLSWSKQVSFSRNQNGARCACFWAYAWVRCRGWPC